MGVVLIILDGDQTVAMQAIVGIVIGRIGVNRRDGPAVELVKTAMIGGCFRVVAVQMPLIDQTGAIPGGSDDGSQRGILGQEVGPTYDGGIALGIDFQPCQSAGIALVIADAAVAAVATGHQRTAGG